MTQAVDVLLGPRLCRVEGEKAGGHPGRPNERLDPGPRLSVTLFVRSTGRRDRAVRADHAAVLWHVVGIEHQIAGQKDGQPLGAQMELRDQALDLRLKPCVIDGGEPGIAATVSEPLNALPPTFTSSGMMSTPIVAACPVLGSAPTMSYV